MPESHGLPSRYEILSELGSGGMGAVFKAKDSYLNKILAIKILKNEVVEQDSSIVQRFQREAKALAKLQNEHFVTVLDFGLSDDNFPYLVMEYVEGETFSQYIENRTEMDFGVVIDYAIQIGKAMQYAHEHGIVHRDLKPANLIITNPTGEEPIIKIFDFGIAQIVGGNDSKEKLTMTNAILGSPLYMSPEQALGDKADERSDIYSFGCIIYECITGTVPFRGATPMDTMFMHMNEEIPAMNMEDAADEVPEKLETLVRGMLAKSPDERIQTMGEVLEELEAIRPASPDSNFVIDAIANVPLKKVVSTFAILFLIYSSFIVFSPQGRIFVNETRANLGEAKYQLKLGKLYLYGGKGIEKDYKKAFYWLHKAAIQGNSPAQFLLSWIYRYGFGKEKSIDDEIKWLLLACKGDNPLAQQRLGTFYETGTGVTKNYRKAMALYRKSAKGGNQNANFHIGRLYYYGYGVELNYEMSMKYCKRAGEFAPAIYTIGVMYDLGSGVAIDHKKAFQYYRSAARKNYQLAQYKLGRCYHFGIGTEINFREALHWYSKAAENENADGRVYNNLGLLYRNGLGVKRDDKKALKYFEKAVKLGSAAAMTSVGAFYRDGRAVDKDNKMAFKYFKSAAKLNDPQGITNFGLCFLEGTGVNKDGTKAVRQFKRAVQLKDSDAMFNLAQCYFQGNGIAKNKAKAIRLLKKASKNGHKKARRQLSNLSKYNRLQKVNRRRSSAVVR